MKNKVFKLNNLLITFYESRIHIIIAFQIMGHWVRRLISYARCHAFHFYLKLIDMGNGRMSALGLTSHLLLVRKKCLPLY